MKGVAQAGAEGEITYFSPEAAKIEDLHRVHDPSYVESLRRFCLMGGGQLDPDTTVSIDSWDAAILAAGSGLSAIRRLRNGEADSAFLAVRPPGHHAVVDQAMGFCLINNVAVAAARLASEGERVFIFDFDAHHGNGTQEIFYNDPHVLYASVHQYPLYPGTGRADQIGAGEGLGATINIPVPAFTTYGTYRSAIDEIIWPVVDSFSPTWVIASAGFDSHRDDPLTDLGLTASDYGELTDWLIRLVPPGRRLVFLEGGYDLKALSNSTASTIAALAGGRLVTEEPSDSKPLVPVIESIKRARAIALEI